MSFTNTDTPLLIRLHRQFLFFLPDSPRVSRLAALAGALLPVAWRYRDVGAAQAAAAVGASNWL